MLKLNAPPAQPAPAQRIPFHGDVRVVDIQMPIGSMMVFMIKWAIASIPAMFVLMAIGALIWFVIFVGIAALIVGAR